MRSQAPDVVTKDSVVLPRFVFGAAVAAGADAVPSTAPRGEPNWTTRGAARAEQSRSLAQPTLSDLARQLGYSDPRAAGRALRRLGTTPAR